MKGKEGPGIGSSATQLGLVCPQRDAKDWSASRAISAEGSRHWPGVRPVHGP